MDWRYGLSAFFSSVKLVSSNLSPSQKSKTNKQTNKKPPHM
jgi:hypothetical protein